MKRELYSQILRANNTAITGKVITGLQDSIDTLECRLAAKLDRQSDGLDRNTEVTERGKIASNQPKLGNDNSYPNRKVWNGDLESISNERDYDTRLRQFKN